MTQCIYYVYMYLRKKDLTPFYIGKGKNKRAFSKDHKVKVPSTDRIKIIAKSLTEGEAFLLEEKLISHYGRKDLGTGILRNLTNGGDGVRDYWTPERKTAFSKSRSGSGNPMFGKRRPDVAARSGKLNHNYGKTGVLNPLSGKLRPEHSKLMQGSNNPMKRVAMRKVASERMTGPKNHMFGRVGAAAHLNDIPKLKCEHCSKVVSSGNYSRWHGTNCKQKDNMAKLHVTAFGGKLDIDTLRLQNETTIAVGNLKVNARGDALGPGGVPGATRQQAVNEYYNLHTPVAGGKGPSVPPKPAPNQPVADAQPVVEATPVAQAEPAAVAPKTRQPRGMLASTLTNK